MESRPFAFGKIRGKRIFIDLLSYSNNTETVLALLLGVSRSTRNVAISSLKEVTFNCTTAEVVNISFGLPSVRNEFSFLVRDLTYKRFNLSLSTQQTQA